MGAPVLILTHREDHYNVDLIAAALARRGVSSARIDTDRYPLDVELTLELAADGRASVRLDAGSGSIDLARVPAVYCRRLWPGRGALAGVDPRFAAYCAHASAQAFMETLAVTEGPFFLNPIEAARRAESKPLQLRAAAAVGLRIPETLLTNAPREVRALRDRAGRPLVTKLLAPLSESMDASGDFVYTSVLEEADYGALEGLRAAPQLFQPLVEKRRELRVVVVGDRIFAGAIEVPPGRDPLAIDWRRPRAALEASPWTRAALPAATEARSRALLARLGIHMGALDFLDDGGEEPLFLEVNPAGEWGWLERDLGLQIAEAVAELLIERGGGYEHEHEREWGGEALSDVLIVTRSEDDEAVASVAGALIARGGRPIRLDTDRYPLDVRVTARCGPEGRFARRLETASGACDLGGVSAVWYRRMEAGRSLPRSLGDTLEHCVAESRRALLGTIAALEGFQLDPWVSVRKADHKELQLARAAAAGLDVPRTLVSNDAIAVRAFAEEVGGRLVTKMQSSFAIYREGKELVVFTTPVSALDLEDLSGLAYCPMTFQEWIPKRFDVRAVVVGRRVLAARLDSQRRPETATDWRRDGVGTIAEWEAHALPVEVERGLLEVTREFGLNYAAADFVETPDGRHVFLEINAAGEWVWLERCPGLPIGEAIADVLLGREPRARPPATWPGEP